MTPLLPLETARTRVLEAVSVLAPVTRPLGDAQGCVLAADVAAADPVPPFDNSAMDGFAVRAADTRNPPTPLKVVETVLAGGVPTVEVGAGEATRIMTGAPLPRGADAVVRIEDTRDIGEAQVEITATVDPGRDVRRAGEDIPISSTVLHAGDQLTAVHLGVAASVGAEQVRVHPRPRVGVLSTGDELSDAPPGALPPGRIRNSNRPLLLGLVREAGCVPVDLGTAPDDLDAIGKAIGDAPEVCDAMLTTGGVSVGDRDLLADVLADLGRHESMRVAIKPGKPFALGVVDGMPVFALPGNPVSAAVSFELLARPALRRMAAHRTVTRPRVVARTIAPVPRRPDGRVHHIPAQVWVEADGVLRVGASDRRGSHQLTALLDADGLLVLPDGDGVPADAPVGVLLLRELGRSHMEEGT